VALRIALDKMPKLNWMACCEAAIEKINSSEMSEFVRCSETIQSWHRKFQLQGERFTNPAIARKGPRSLPPFLERNPDAKDAILKFSREHLHELSAELLYTFIHEKVLPEVAKVRTTELKSEVPSLVGADWDEDNITSDNEEDGGAEQEDCDPFPNSKDQIENAEVTVEQLLRESRLRTLDLYTVYRWMNALGFKYEPRKKHFFVDSHEKKENTQFRDDVFVPEYLARELRMHRWLHLPAAEANALIQKGELSREKSHRFQKDGYAFVEYHVDDHSTFLERGAALHPFGGLLSVRMPADTLPAITIGQDEAIFKQFLSWWKAWSGPGGLKALWPKDDGLAVMISAMVSREFGFGVDWTDDLAKRVNEYRRGQFYSDTDSALKVHGVTEKRNLHPRLL